MSTPVSLSDTASMPRRQEGRANATCRTCKSCRRRKVRCDGRQPRCTTCALKDQQCEYPQDARRAAVRGKRPDVRQLLREVEALRERVRLHEGQTLSPECSLGSPSLTRHPSSCYSVVDTNTTGLITHNDQTSQERSFPQEPPPNIPLEKQSLPIDPREGVLDSASGPLNRITRRDVATGILSPQPTSEEPEMRVYGATSLLFDESSAAMLSPPRADKQDENFLTRATKDGLISNAAIGRHSESTIYSMPSVSSRIDFDGVPMDLAMHLLELHWNRQHLAYLITYRPAIMDSLINNGPYINKLLLNAIYFSTSLYSDRISPVPGPNTSQPTSKTFYNRFKALLMDHVEKPSLPTIVALVICGCSLVPHGEQSVGWVFCGMAYRMITDLGYHLDIPTSSQAANEKLSALDIEIRRRVYWGAYVCDKNQSLYLGRSPALRRGDSNVSQTYFDTFEETEEWKPYLDPDAQRCGMYGPAYPGRPTYAISTFNCLLGLCDITAQIIDEFYSTIRTKMSKFAALQSRDEIRASLEHWKQRLPPNLQFEPGVDPTPPPHQITLHTTYWALVILTEQAFLKRGHFNFSVDESAELEGERRCIEAALKITVLVETYKESFTLRRAQYGISYATYCAVLVMLQQAPQHRNKYMDRISFLWSALLEYQRGCNRGLRRPLMLLKSLMNRLENVSNRIDLDQLDSAHGMSNFSIAEVSGGSMFNSETDGSEGVVSWDTTWLNSVGDEFSFADDTIFGIFK